jgi:preprotein translocase subunit SecD
MKGTGRLWVSITVVAVLVALAVAGFIGGIRPLLGLDLSGGVQVVLQGPSSATKDVMQKALERIRTRVDALGVAEPDISLLSGNLIQVQLPGLGGQGHVVKQGNQYCAYSDTGKVIPIDATHRCTTNQAQAQAKAKAQSVQRVLQIIGTTAQLEERQVLRIISPTDPTYKTTQLTARDPDTGKFLATGPVFTYLASSSSVKFRRGTDPIYQLGPIVITGADLTKAQAQFLSASNTNSGNTGWQVAFTLDKTGTKAFADETTKLVSAPAPTNELAIVLDGVVVSSPVVQGAITGGSGVITGQFTAPQAKNLALVLQSGALPVELKRLTVETVSPLLGKQSLRQGVIAGLVGLALLMLYLAFYYRLLGIVTWFGMAIWGTFALGLVSLLGHTVGYALTLAGVAGIIVSLGITADSYIVFYERLKDEVRHGKSLRAAVQPAFKRAYKTIVAADIVTMIAALVLYMLAIGSVRGFALTLGLSTALDLFVVYFFKRPVVFLISRNPVLSEIRGIGLRSGVAADPIPVAGGAE